MGIKEHIENKLRNIVKRIVKTITKPLKIAGIVVAIFALIIIFLAGNYDALADAFSKKVSEHMQSSTIDYTLEDGTKINYINIKDEDIEELIDLIEEIGIDIAKLKLTKEDMKVIYAAEVVTTEVNRLKNGEEPDPDKYYGRVFIERVKEVDDDLNPIFEKMDYIELSELEEKVEEYKNCTDKDKEPILRAELLKYFAMENDEICFVDQTSCYENEEGAIETNASIKKLQYKDRILQFIVPVEFLLDTCFISQNPGFTLALAEKIINETEINLAILPTTTDTNTITTYKYQEEQMTATKTTTTENGKVVSQNESTSDPNILPNESEYYEEKSETNLTTVTSELKPESVKTWFMNLKYQYKQVEIPETIAIPETDPSNIMEDEEWPPYTSTGSSVVENDDGSITQTISYVSTRKVNQTKRQDITINTLTYQSAPTPEREDKTDDIVKMLKTGYKNPGTNLKVAPLSNLDSGSGIYFNMLKNGERTQDLEQLMRYILGKATGKDYGVSDFDFSIYDIKEFSSTIGSAQNLATYLRQFSHSGEAPKSSDGRFYKMYVDGEGWPTIGNADIQWKSHASKFNVSGMVLENGEEKQVDNIRNYVNGFLTRGEAGTYTSSEIDAMQIYIETSVVDSIGNDIQSVYYNAVQAYVNGLNLSRQQLYALTAIKYNFGSLPPRNGYTFREVYESGAALYEVNSWQHNKFIWDNWWCYLGGGEPGHIPARDAAFETYVKGVYDFSTSAAGEVFGRNYYIYYTSEQLARFSYAPNKKITRTSANEQEIFSYTLKSGSGLLEAAYEVHHAMESGQGNWTYSLGTGLYWNDIEKSLNNPNKVTCCATYVSCSLYVGGYISEQEANSFNYNSSNALYNYLRNVKGWEEINSSSSLEAGDIVFMTSDSSGGKIGHVQIYAGDNKWYNAGSTEAIQKSNPYTMGASYIRSRFVTAIRPGG